MAVDEAVLKRIKKLLALATSSNEHEAALAASKAQALMFQHNLEMAAISGVDLSPDVTKVIRERVKAGATPGTGTQWRVDLADAVASYGFCDVVIHGRGKYMQFSFIGRRADLEVAKYTYEFLTERFSVLVQEYGKTRWAEAKAEAKAEGITFHQWERDHSWDHPLKAKNSWLHGAVSGARTKMREEYVERREASEQANALVVVRGEEVALAVKEMFPKLGVFQASRSFVDGTAFGAGKVAGYAAAGAKRGAIGGSVGSLR